MIFISLLLFSGELTSGLLFLIAVIQEVFNTISRPSINSLLPFLINKKHILSANSKLDIGQNLSKLLGFGVSSTLIAIIGVEKVTFLASITFIISTLLFSLINIKITSSYENKTFTSFKDFKSDTYEGFKFLKNNLTALSIVIISAIANFAIAPISVFIPEYLQKVLAIGANGYSVFYVFLTIGTISGGIILNKLTKVINESTIFSGSFFISGVSMITLYLIKNISFLGISSFFID